MEQPSPRPVMPPAKAAHHELRTAENSAAHVLAKLPTMLKTNPHLNLLDVGAGSGTIAASLAKRIPEGHVTGVDLDPEVIPRAWANAEAAGVKNLEFQQGDVYKLPFADDTFDITTCHQMLTHLKTPWDALSEMLRVTKPGGIVAAREGDQETECYWPAEPGVVKFHDFAGKMMRAVGGTSQGGRQLLPWALKAGVERSNIEVGYSTWAYTKPEDRQVWAQGIIQMIRNGRFRDCALDNGLVTEDEIEEMASGWETWKDREDASVAMMHCEIVIWK